MSEREIEDEQTSRVRAWLEAELGHVVRIERQGRWRPAWFADVERASERLALCVRGDRVDMPLVFPLAHEMRVQQLLHEHGIPVARVHGLIEQPLAYVMDRVPGRNDFAGASEAERAAVVDDYLRVLARLHALDVRPFAQAGVLRAPSPAESGVFGIRRYEQIFRATKNGPEPFMEFCLGWLRRNPPISKGREAVIVWDSGQFHHAGGRVTALLDLELAHIGDPMMDLAAWRMRDTVIGYGDFEKLYARYEELSGRALDRPALMRHHFAFTLTNQLVFGAALREPPPESDLMTNAQWCCETNLFATEALAEILGIPLPSIETPAPRESRARTALAQLVQALGAIAHAGGERSMDQHTRYQLRAMFRLARHAARIDEIGEASSGADLEDLHALFGRRPASWRAGEAELERFVLADAAHGRHDAALVPLFHKRNLRAQALLGPAGSAMSRHLPIQKFA
ncbi:MAG TPA: phosphotransferase family protein [Myxococcota bacterium]|nr:phosphotransferase family protein [Myxococcota bacterium]